MFFSTCNSSTEFFLGVYLFHTYKKPPVAWYHATTRLRGVQVGVDAVFWLRSIQALKDFSLLEPAEVAKILEHRGQLLYTPRDPITERRRMRKGCLITSKNREKVAFMGVK